MTALQQIIKEAKILRKKNPKMEWKKAVAQASAIYASKHKGKSPVGKKHKKVARKKAIKKVGKVSSKYKNPKYNLHNINTKKNIVSFANIKDAKEFLQDAKQRGLNVKITSAKKVGTVKRKVAKKKKPSEQSILNKIHKVKHDVERLDEAQHKHMSGIGSNTIKQIQNNLDQLVHLERKKLIYEDWKKNVKNLADKKRLNQMIKSVKDLIKEHKTHIIQLKKHIK
jgi:hypothetical protein